MTTKKVFEYFDGKDISIQKLSIKEQLRYLFRQVFSAGDLETERQLALSEAEMTLRANFIEFIDKATDPLSKGINSSVDVIVSSRFIKVLPYVTAMSKFSKYFEFEYTIPEFDYVHDYQIPMRIRTL